ncbi:MAG: hypothetical protein M3P93_14685 [Actinomycetota bacterium]|nr:hypothetical protein [Actinomycetota bacterium]
MRTSRLVVAVALTAMTAACGGSDDTAGTGGGAPLAEQSSAAAPEASASANAGAGGGQVLTAALGEEGKPDSFVLSLTDSTGNKVTSLPAGQYQIEVDDQSDIHNFHLTGAGDVEESTSVPDKESPTWTVDLQAGDYKAVCDPHPQMRVDFTVT